MKKLLSLTLCLLLLSSCATTYDGPTETIRVLTSREMTLNGHTTRTVMAYDIHGNCVTTHYYNGDKLTTVEERTFDESGHVLTETATDRTGLFPRKLHEIHCTYDDQGRLLTRAYANGSGREQERTEYTYNGNTVTETVLPSGLTAIREYDNAGLLLRITRPDSDLETVYTYDAQGRELSSRTAIGGVEESWSASAYDDQGRLIRFTHSDSTNSYTCTYTAESMTQTAANGSTRTEYYDPDGQIVFAEGFDTAGNQTMKQIFTYSEIQIAAGEEGTP